MIKPRSAIFSNKNTWKVVEKYGIKKLVNDSGWCMFKDVNGAAMYKGDDEYHPSFFQWLICLPRVRYLEWRVK